LADVFSQKLLSFSFSLAQGSFGSGGNTPTVNTDPNGAFTGVRASVHIDIAGGVSTKIEAAIYGLPLSLMNQLTLLPGITHSQGNDTLTMQAGDSSGMTTVYEGTVYQAWMDGSAQPHVPFRVIGNAAQLARHKPNPSTSVAGAADVATIAKKLAGQMGLAFENNGVVKTIQNLYLHGPAGIQVEQLARMAGIRASVNLGKLAIFNPEQGRTSQGNIIISPKTGMVGYPAWDQAQIVVKTVFDPSVFGDFGQRFTVEGSQIAVANATWTVTKSVLDLESNMPKGKWFQTFWGGPISQQQVP
jgi:hypothetical protein